MANRCLPPTHKLSAVLQIFGSMVRSFYSCARDRQCSAPRFGQISVRASHWRGCGRYRLVGGGALFIALGAGVIALLFTLVGGGMGGYGMGRHRGGFGRGGGGFGGGGFGGGGASGRW